ncbi:MAG TPA: hypothetical protein VFU47_05235, partial [Armatimonadota bacterium]|nr:hypothetical protein [Armatimonadota bacterium]
PGGAEELTLSYSAPGAELALLADEFEALLRDRSVPCPPERTWDDHLLNADGAVLDIVRAREFVERYNSARFGAGDTGSLENILRDLQASRQTTVPVGVRGARIETRTE